MGQPVWNSSAETGKNYIVNPILEKRLSYDARIASNFGKLSSKMGMFKDNGRLVGAEHADNAIASKPLDTTDEARFSLVQNLRGAPTYGDSPVQSGEYLDYLHDNMRVNQIDSPAWPTTGEMSYRKIKDLLGNEQSEIRRQGVFWHSEEYAMECARALVNGSSNALRAPKTEGGLAVDFGRGVTAGRGKKCSPENTIIINQGVTGQLTQGGWLSPSGQIAADLDTFETNIATHLNNLDTGIGTSAAEAAKCQPSVSFIKELREAISYKKFESIGGSSDMGGKYYVACDPAFMQMLADPSGELYTLWKGSQVGEERAKLYKVPNVIEIEDICFYREPYLRYLRLSKTVHALDGGKSITGYGSNNAEFTYGVSDMADFRDNFPTTADMTSASSAGARWGMCMVMGRMSAYEGTSGSMTVHVEKGRFDKGFEINMRQMYGIKRRRFISQNGQNVAPLQRQFATILFHLPMVSRYGV